MNQHRIGFRTGEVARLLDVAEHTLSNLVRFRLIEAPQIVCGRRAWRNVDVAAARRVLVSRGVIADTLVVTDPPVDPHDLAQDLAAELEHEDACNAPMAVQP